jgi:glycosyltransferase involved in cell wall biosynthesis
LTQPSVSVVVAAHNPEYLGETLRSIAGQNLAHLDVVLVDDGSEPRLSAPRGLPFPVRIVRHEVPLERAVARNTGLREAQGDWVMVLDHDDLLAQGAIPRMLAVAETTGCDAVFARTSRIVAEASAPFVARGSRRRRPRPIRWWQVFCSSDHFGMVLAKAELARRVGFAAEFVPADDYLYAIALAATTEAVRVEFIVGGWRQHPRQTTQLAGDSIASAVTSVRHHVMASYAPRGIVRRRVSAYTALRSDAYSAWSAGDYPAFRRAVCKAAIRWPPLLMTKTGLIAAAAVARRW